MTWQNISWKPQGFWNENTQSEIIWTHCATVKEVGGGRGNMEFSMRKENRKFSRTKNVCIEIDIRHPFPIAFPPPCSDAYSQCKLEPTSLWSRIWIHFSLGFIFFICPGTFLKKGGVRRSNIQFFKVFFCYFIKGLTPLCSTTLFYSSVRNINGDSSASMLTFERARTTSFSGSQLLALMARKTRARLIFG